MTHFYKLPHTDVDKTIQPSAIFSQTILFAASCWFNLERSVQTWQKNWRHGCKEPNKNVGIKKSADMKNFVSEGLNLLRYRCKPYKSCTDPESVSEGSPNSTLTGFLWFLVMGERSHHFNGVLLVGLWWPNISSFVIFKGIRTSISRKPYSFAIFQVGVSGPPAPPIPLDPRMKTNLRGPCE